MINFDECDVIINGTGLTADSASLSTNNTMEPMYGLGFNKTNLIASGPVVTNIQINYRPNIDKEANFFIINDLKNNTLPIPPINLEIGGLECSGYLTNYSISARPNAPTQASASYISYSNLNGDLTPKRDTIQYELNTDNLGHGLTTLVNYNSGNTGMLVTYDFDYEINFNYDPIYAIGKKEPSQVVVLGGKESIKLVKENFLKVDFSGELGSKQLFPNGTSSVYIYNLSNEWDISRTGSLYFDFSDVSIISSRISAGLGNYVNVEISAERVF